MEPETTASESGADGDGLARQPVKEVSTTRLNAAAAEHLELEQDEGESLVEFAARYAARGAARTPKALSRARRLSAGFRARLLRIHCLRRKAP